MYKTIRQILIRQGKLVLGRLETKSLWNPCLSFNKYACNKYACTGKVVNLQSLMCLACLDVKLWVSGSINKSPQEY